MLLSIQIFKQTNKQTQQRFLALAAFIICLPPEKPRDIAFFPISPLVRAKMAGIVNKPINRHDSRDGTTHGRP